MPLKTEDLNIMQFTGTDYAVYGNELYWTGASQSDTKLYSLDLPKYRAPEARKYMLPFILSPGDTLDLKPLVNGAVEIEFESGYAVPPTSP